MTKDVKHPEIGRSMVEMLGTLAIMGVLTIGGIAGYNYAITKYRANTLFTEAKMNAVQVVGLALTHGLPEEFSLNTDTYHLNYEKESDIGYVLYANDIDAAVCRIVQRNRKVSWAELVLINEGQGCLEADNLIEFYINTRMDTETTNPDRADLCESDADCGECGTCQSGGVCLFKNDACTDPAKPYCNHGTCQKCRPDYIERYGGWGSGDIDLKGNLTCSKCPTDAVYTTPEQCEKCNKMTPGGYFSVQWHRSFFNVCMTCGYTGDSGRIPTTPAECRKCSNRCYSEKTGYCFPLSQNMADTNHDGICDEKCPDDQIEYTALFGSGDVDLKSGWKCIACNTTGMYTTAEQCHKCQQQNPGQFYAVKYWGRNFFNLCLPCSIEASIYSTTREECDQCANRYFSDGLCRACPEKDSEAWHNLTADQQEQCTPD
ncbi:MAG: hypothetical protein IJV07_04775 [Alphaproteobacteria bacterium]|nr:hypothetical protein [Alphaproteobacteria bacterium]